MKQKSASEWFNLASTVVLVVCALAVTGMVARRELLPPPPPPLVTTLYDDWRELTERGHRFGKKAAPVQVVVFSDYQCPYCRSVTPTIEQLLTKYPDEVAVTYRPSYSRTSIRRRVTPPLPPSARLSRGDSPACTGCSLTA